MSQANVIAFLSDAANYGPGIDRVEIHETHGALVFLAGSRAYKMKRSVRYSYLDYSTPDLRRKMCEAELEVNRRIAPALYLEVRPIVRTAEGTLRFGELTVPEAEDWVLVMRRFPQSALLEQMRKDKSLTPALMQELGATIAQFHETAQRRTDRGGASDMTAVADEIVDILRSFAGNIFDTEKVETFASLASAELFRVAATLEARREAGLVRQCHGDLHLNNICMLDGHPVPFDAIEFNDSYSIIDVLYDLAFLLMDLERHRLGGHANAVFNAWLEQGAYYGGLETLPLFLGCRAAIRAHVTATLVDREADEEQPSWQHRLEAERLLDESLVLLAPQPARLIAIGGPSGTGKSTLARALAPQTGSRPGAVVLRSDVIRKRLFGVSPTTRLPAEAYSPAVSRRVYANLCDMATLLLRSGRTVIADAVFGSRAEQDQIAVVASQHKCAFNGFWLEGDPAILAQRISGRAGDASDATVDVLNAQLLSIERPVAWHGLDVVRLTTEAATDEILHLLE